MELVRSERLIWRLSNRKGKEVQCLLSAGDVEFNHILYTIIDLLPACRRNRALRCVVFLQSDKLNHAKRSPKAHS